MIGAGPLGRAPASPPPADDDGGGEDDTVHVHFPVEIEVRAAAAPVDVDEIVERTLRKLAPRSRRDEVAMVAEVSFPIRVKLDAAALAGGTATLDEALAGALTRALGNARGALGGKARVVTHAPTFAWTGGGATGLNGSTQVGVQGAVTQVVNGAALAAGLPAPTAGARRRKKRKKPWRILSAANVRCRLADYLEFCNGVLPFSEDLPSLYIDYWEEEIWVSAWVVTTDKGMAVAELVTAVDKRQRELSRYVESKHEVVGLWSIWGWVRGRLIEIDRGREAATLAAMGSPYSVYVEQYTGQERVNPRGRLLFVMGLLPKLRWEDTAVEVAAVRTVTVQLRDLIDFVDDHQFEQAHRVRWRTYLAELGGEPAEVQLAPFLIRRPWSFRSLVIQSERAFHERTAGQTVFGGMYLLSEAAITGLPEAVRAVAREESNAVVLAAPAGAEHGVWPAFAIGAMVWTAIEPNEHKRLIALYRPGGREDADDVVKILKSDLTTFVKSLRLGSVMRRHGSGEFAARFAFMLDALEPRDGGRWFRGFFSVCTSSDADFATHHALVTVARDHWYVGHPLVVAAGESLAARSRRESEHGYAVDEIRLGKSSTRVVRPGDRLLSWHEQWAFEESEHQLTDQGLKRLEKALHEQTLAVLKELLADPDKRWDEEELAGHILQRALDQTPLEKGDVREVEYLRTLVLSEVRPYDDGGLQRWDIHGYWVRAERGTSNWKFLARTGRGGWKEVDDAGQADEVVMGKGELEERMFFWEFAQGSKAVIGFSKIVTWGGLFLIAWELRAIQLLVDLAGGWGVVGTSIALSELFYILSGEELTFEGFLITALIGYLSALTFRFVAPGVTPFAKGAGKWISGASLLRFFAGWMVERMIVGAAVGGATGLLTTFVLDLIHVAAGGRWSSPWDYVRNAKQGMLYGAVFECGVTAVGTLFRAQGLHALEKVMDIAASLKKNGIRPGALVADFGQCYRTFALWLDDILQMQGAELAAAVKQRFGDLVEAMAGNVRASVMLRVLDLAEVTTLTPTQAQALERLLLATEGRLSQQAGLDLANAMVAVKGRIGAYLEALAVVDDVGLATLAQEGLLIGLVDAPAVLALMTATPRDAIALLRGAFKGRAADFEQFLGQSVTVGAAHQASALAFLLQTAGHVAPDLVLIVLRASGRWTPEVAGGLARLVAQAGDSVARTTLQGAPTASIEPFLGVVGRCSDKAMLAIIARPGDLQALAALAPRSLKAFADVAQGVPSSALDKAAASPHFVKAVEAAGEVVDHIGIHNARAMYGVMLPKKSHVPAMWATRLDAAATASPPSPLQPTSWILDSQASISLTKVADGTADANHGLIAAELARLRVADIRVTPSVIAETPPIPGTARGGISLTVARTDPDYQAVVVILKTKNLDPGDLAVTADALFAARAGAFNPPLFISDRTFANKLAALAGAPVGGVRRTFTLTITPAGGAPRSITIVRYTP